MMGPGTQLLLALVCCCASLPALGQMDMPGMDHSSMPMGQTADGLQQANPATTLPLTQTPQRLPNTLQEQEHPRQQTGSPHPAVPDLLQDVRAHAPQPLSFFLEKALAANPTIRIAAAQVRRLQGEAKQQALWSNPEVGYEADHIRGGSYASGEQGGYIQQTVPLAGQRSTASAAVRAQANAAQTALDAQMERVRSGVEQAFYGALAMQKEVDVRAQLMHVTMDAAETAHQLANVGQADAPDILQSEVEREEAVLDYATAQRAYRKAFTVLAALSGDARLPVTPLQGDLVAFPHLADDVAEHAAETSPALLVSRQEASAADAAVRAARRQAMPQLTVHAGLQQSNEPLESTGGRVGIVGVAQAGITLPLWNRNQGAVEAAKAAADASIAEVARTDLQLRMQAEQTSQDYATARLTVERYRDELLPRATRAYDLYRQKYAVMAAAYPQVLVSQRTLFQLQVEYVRALNNAWQSAILLQHGLLAGGLDTPGSGGPKGTE